MSGEIIVRKCESLEDFHRCVELQREIWGEADLEVEPATMFVVAAHTGGEVLGAFDGDRLVGYTLAFVGVRDRTTYLHVLSVNVSYLEVAPRREKVRAASRRRA